MLTMRPLRLTSDTTSILGKTHLDPLLTLLSKDLTESFPHPDLEVGEEFSDTEQKIRK